jgi:hypothetical protein
LTNRLTEKSPQDMKKRNLLIALTLTANLILPTQALAACSGTGCVVNDTFSRTVATGWGTAPTGGAWDFKWWDDGVNANSQAMLAPVKDQLVCMLIILGKR